MRILMTTNYLPPYEGGIQFVVDELARGYVRAGHEVVLTGYDPARAKRGVVPYAVVSLPAWNPLEARSIPVPLYEPVALRRQTRRLLAGVDAVHGHGLLYPNVLYTVHVAARASVPVVVTEHVGLVSFGRPWLDRIQSEALARAGRFVASRSRAVVVLNDRVQAELSGPVADRTALVRIDNGVDTDRFRPAGDADERERLRDRWSLTRPTALFVGRLSQKKGVELAIDAARQSGRFDLVVCGKDTEALTDVPGNVRVIGLVDQEALATLYRACDLLVLPSEGEGFPLVIQEALASGLPVVVTEGTVSATDHATSTVQFASRNPTGIVRAVHALLDRDDTAELARRGREVALECFDWKATVDRYLEHLEPLPDQRSR